MGGKNDRAHTVICGSGFSLGSGLLGLVGLGLGGFGCGFVLLVLDFGLNVSDGSNITRHGPSGLGQFFSTAIFQLPQL